LQKGVISVKSKPGRGAEFIFDIPYALAKMTANDGVKRLDAGQVNEIKHDNSQKILVVEDNEFNIMLLSVLLGRMGYPFDIVSDGEIALTNFMDGDYGLVITDINLPRMTGLELAELIRKYEDRRKASIPIIVLTADLLVNEHDLGKEGINAVVTKPFKESVLRKHIDSFMAV
jgi:CheY-like chemotaxis protein